MKNMPFSIVVGRWTKLNQIVRVVDQEVYFHSVQHFRFRCTHTRHKLFGCAMVLGEVTHSYSMDITEFEQLQKGKNTCSIAYIYI